MTFVSDNSRKRTFDPDRNIELMWDRGMSDGTEFLRLCTSSTTLHFTMHTSFDHMIDEEGGREKTVIVRHVHFRGRPLEAFTVVETRRLIEEALQSFKRMYGMPQNEFVRVLFE